MISVVIPNYNGRELLEKNLPKLLTFLKKSELKYELIVVDDFSTDKSVEFLRSQEGISLIERTSNSGFPISAHQGFLESKGDIVFVIKNDAIPERADYFKLLLDHFKDPKVFAVSAALKTIENGKEEIRGCGIIYYERGFFLHKRGEDTSKISSWADGSSSAFRREAYFKVGGFDPIFAPGYWEDVDLGYRAWKAGYKIDFEVKAVLLHDFEQSVYKKKYGDKLPLINVRNQFNFVWANADMNYIWKYIFWLPIHYLISIKNWDFTLIKGHLWSLSQSIQLFKIRAKRKKLYKFSDDEVLKLFK